MDTFDGFPPGKEHLTRIPLTFFKDLLPKIDDLGELKVTLYAFWQLDRTEGDIRYFQIKDIMEDEIFCGSMGKTAKEAKEKIEASLEKAAQRGTFLTSEISLPDGKEVLFFFNTPRGQAAIGAIEQGNWEMAEDAQSPIKLKQATPNIFRLYEENIGPLTPVIAEMLEEAEAAYPYHWIEEAFQEAVKNNVRKWRYIEVILQNRQEGGNNARTYRKTDKEDERRFIDEEIRKRFG